MEQIKICYRDDNGECKYVVTDNVHIKLVNGELRLTCKQTITGTPFDICYQEVSWIETTTLQIGGVW